MHGISPDLVERINVSLTPEVKERLIQEALTVFGRRKGRMSVLLEMILRNRYKMSQPGVDEV